MKCSLIIVAAGSSTRFGGDKQTALLCGMPLFLHSVKNLSSLASECVVVVPPGRTEEFRALAARSGFDGLLCVEGGPNRTDSVIRGLSALKASKGLVAVHDAARPLATSALLERLMAAAEQTGGAIPGHPVVDTLMRADDAGIAVERVPRDGVWAVSTPQVFDLERLREAYRSQNGRLFTDDSQAFMAAGGRVSIVPEDAPNLKVTYPDDLKAAEACLSAAR